MADRPDVLLFTDGACSGNPGPGGWAAILRHPPSGREKRLWGGDPSTTNNKMELTAVIEGLKALKSGRRRRVQVFSDSEYVVRGMTDWIHNWIAHGWRRGRKAGSPVVKNADLWQALHGLCQGHDVEFVHVRGHAGHPENEACDELAVAATRRAARERQPFKEVVSADIPARRHGEM